MYLYTRDENANLVAEDQIDSVSSFDTYLDE